MKVNLSNQVTGEYKVVKVGYSWTNFFFGFFTPLCRGDWKWAIIQLVIALLTSGLSWLVIPFFYNKWYIKDLINKGFLPDDSTSANILISKDILTNRQMELASEGKAIQTDLLSNITNKVTSSMATNNSSDAIEQLEKLSRLKENGVITQDEFEQKKEVLLKQI